MIRHEADYDAYQGTDADTGEQYLVRVYRDSHGTTRTVATRPHVGATWSPEHLLLAVAAGEAS